MSIISFSPNRSESSFYFGNTKVTGARTPKSALFSLGNSTIAEEYLLKSLKTEPYNYDFLYAVRTFYLEHKQNSKALEYAKRLVEKYPQNPAAVQLFKAAPEPPVQM